MMVPLFVPNVAEKLARYAINCLAVGGGFLVGYLLGWAVAYALNRWLLAHKTPEMVQRAFRITAGLLVAILVAMIVFGDGGGGGLGGGTGMGIGGSGTEGAGKAETQPAPKEKDKPPEPVEIKPLPKEVLLPGGTEKVPVRVDFLGGSDVGPDGRVYRLNLDPDRIITFEELTAAINTIRKEAGDRGVYLILVRTGTNPIAPDSLNVSQVERWARKQKIEVRWPEEPEKNDPAKK